MLEKLDIAAMTNGEIKDTCESKFFLYKYHFYRAMHVDLKPGFWSLATVKLVVNVVSEL